MITLGLQLLEVIPISADAAAYIGVSLMIVFIALAVYNFIKYGMQLEEFEKYEKELVEINYEDKKFLEKIKDGLNFPQTISSSVILFIISPLPILIASFIFDDKDSYVLFGVAITLILVGLGVYRIIKTAVLNDLCEQLLQTGEYTEARKRTTKKYNNIFSAYWMIIVIAYLVVSFLTKRWDITWLIWPVAGILFAIINTLLTKE